MRYIKQRMVASHLQPEEYQALHAFARRSRQSVSMVLRSIIIDLLCEEGYDFSKCSRSKGSPQAGESLSLGGGAAS